MVRWIEWDKGQGEWDRCLSLASDSVAFQAFGWGEYKRQSNWLPLRYCCVDEQGEVLVMVQLLVKKLPLGIVLIWAPGGPVLGFKSLKHSALSELLGKLVDVLRARFARFLFRLSSHQQMTNTSASYAVSAEFEPAWVRLNSGYSVRLLSDGDRESLLARMTSKHRYYTKKALVHPIEWRYGSSGDLLDDMLSLHREMTEAKGVTALQLEAQDLREMVDQLQDGVLICVGYVQGKPVSGCLVLLFASKAFYLYAATNEEGRSVNAAYAMLLQLLISLKEMGIHELDFGGVDASNPTAKGVNHFKLGFGGELIQYLGEREVASSQLWRIMVNLAIKFSGKSA